MHLGIGAVARSAVSHLPFSDVHSTLSDTDEAILWQLRAPRVVLGVLVGGMLALAGGAYQGVFRNPLVDPYLLGVAAGAGLGATLAISYGGSTVHHYDLLPMAAFLGAALGVTLAYLLGHAAGEPQPGGARARRRHGRLVPDGGADLRAAAALGVAAGGLRLDPRPALDRRLARRGARRAVHRRSARLCSCCTGGCSTCSASATRRPRRSASTSRRVRLVVVVAATVGTAAAVAVSGLIAFVGIIVPHFVRLAVGTSYRIVLPLSLLFGGGFLVLADVLARTLMSPAELPIGVVTAFFGAPFFAILLRTSKGFT